MDYSGKFRDVRPLKPEDDFNHPVEEHLFFNESRYINLFDSKQRIGGWFRIGNRPNQGYAEVTVCLYLPDGRVGFIYHKPEMRNPDCHAAAGLSFTVDEPFKRMSMRYDGKICLMADGRAMEDPKKAFKENPRVDCMIDIKFDAITSAHGGELLGDDGQPYAEGEGAQFARAHYDQSMHGVGSITLGDETFTIDGYGLRDHSWGPRIWQAMPWYRWYPVSFDESFAVCLSIVKKGNGEYLETGFMLNGDGPLLHLSSIKVKSEYDANNYLTGFTLTCRDELGRDYEIRGETVNAVPCRHVRVLPDGTTDKSRIMESMMRYTCNGKVAYGMAEYMDHVSNGQFEGIVAGF